MRISPLCLYCMQICPGVYVIQSYYISIMYVDSFLCSNTTIVNWSFQFCAADQCDLYTNKKKYKKICQYNIAFNWSVT